MSSRVGVLTSLLPSHGAGVMSKGTGASRMGAAELCGSRMSTRGFLKKEVPEEVIREVLRRK